MHQIKYVGTSPVSLSVCIIVMTNNGNFLKRHSSKTEITVFSLKKMTFILLEFKSAGGEIGAGRISGECLFTEQEWSCQRREIN